MNGSLICPSLFLSWNSNFSPKMNFKKITFFLKIFVRILLPTSFSRPTSFLYEHKILFDKKIKFTKFSVFLFVLSNRLQLLSKQTSAKGWAFYTRTTFGNNYMRLSRQWALLPLLFHTRPAGGKMKGV